MDQFELYDDVVLSFPAIWPSSPDWTWVNVRDGRWVKTGALADLLISLDSPSVVLLIHSAPGTAVRLPMERALEFMAEAILKHEIQVSNLRFTRFVSVSRGGLATRSV